MLYIVVYRIAGRRGRWSCLNLARATAFVASIVARGGTAAIVGTLAA